jgi:hypothetical protein
VSSDYSQQEVVNISISAIVNIISKLVPCTTCPPPPLCTCPWTAIEMYTVVQFSQESNKQKMKIFIFFSQESYFEVEGV